MFSRIRTMLEEYVRSLSRVQKEEPHTNQPTAMPGQSFGVKVPPQKRSGLEYSSK